MVNDDDEAMGGQYAVSIGDFAEGTVGKYCFVLFVMSRTEDRDEWGNTFLSEIDVVAAAAAATPAAAPATAPAATRATAGREPAAGKPALEK